MRALNPLQKLLVTIGRKTSIPIWRARASLYSAFKDPWLGEPMLRLRSEKQMCTLSPAWATAPTKASPATSTILSLAWGTTARKSQPAELFIFFPAKLRGLLDQTSRFMGAGHTSATTRIFH